MFCLPALPNAGWIWLSAELSGSDLRASNIQKMDLVLQPDFVFMFRVSDEGQEVIRRECTTPKGTSQFCFMRTVNTALVTH